MPMVIRFHGNGRDLRQQALSGGRGVLSLCRTLPPEKPMDAFLNATLAVALAEIGDKTQLLSLFLAMRFSNRWAIVAGILVATLLNHAASAWFGQWLAQWLSPDWSRWLVGGSFIAVGLWLLIPDEEDDQPSALDKYGAFIATTLLFFVAEIGDKTQIATVLLAAQYQSVLLVTLGTTLGMMLANVPVVWAGEALMQRLPVRWAHRIACALFIGLGLATLFWPDI